MLLNTLPRKSIIWHISQIILLFIVLIGTLTLLVLIQTQVLTAVRSYVGAEGMWTKAQKESVRALEHYVQTKKHEDYESYLGFIQVPLGDLKARTELQKSDPNLELARAGFIVGGNHPNDIQSMCDLFIRLQHISFMKDAIAHWTQGDVLIAELNNEAEKLHRAVVANALTPETEALYLHRLDWIDQKLTAQENQFSATLADASRWASEITRKISYTIFMLFAAIGLGVSWRVISRIRYIENELLANEANLRISATAFESQESLIITDANGLILRINKAFSQNSGYTQEEVIGQSPRMFKSGRHSPEFYQDMWKTLTIHGFWQGEIWDKRKNGQIYPKWLSISAVMGPDLQISHYIGSYIDITERKESEEKIKHLAFHDHLTNLPNRRLLLDRLKMALTVSERSGKKGALLFIDLDNFKDINDTLGHDIGDLLLQQVAQRLESCLYAVDTVSRMGGDEFVVIVQDLSELSTDAARRAELVGMKVLAALRLPFKVNQNEFNCTASIGITLFDGKEHLKDELMKQADIAMYHAKKSGRNTLRFFDIEMQDAINMRTTLDGELHLAIENQQFQLYYQIQVDETREPIGAEALIRWQNPTRGMLAPAEFIGLAEETGLILPIGKWVLETACAQLKMWQVNDLFHNLVLAINVSANQFYQVDFADQVQSCIKLHAINPKRLKLELTESLMLKDIDDTVSKMNALKNIGVQLSLDDFGTGYSSLQYLKRLPIDQIKIDRSFVNDIVSDSNGAAIVQTIIAMAETLGLTIIAEGVENEEQREFLYLRGCRNFQGYLFGKPVPIEQFEAFLEMQETT
jgi:diguanylate cyclase (GGDEF)-like protein/PAS domain S-box-containing protein